jgi:hypothetical protein
MLRRLFFPLISPIIAQFSINIRKVILLTDWNRVTSRVGEELDARQLL